MLAYLIKAGVGITIVLIAVLVFFLAFVICVLLFPLRYEAKLLADSKRLDEIFLSFQGQILWRFFCFSVRYERKKFSWRLWLCFLPIDSLKNYREGLKKRPGKRAEKRRKPEGTGQYSEQTRQPAGSFKEEAAPGETGKTIKGEKNRKNTKSRKRAGRIWLLLRSDEYLEGRQVIRNCICRLRKKAGLRRVDGEVFFSAADPAVTGMLLGVLGILLPLHQNRLSVRYSFQEENHFSIDGKVGGRIFLFGILAEVLRMVLHRQTRRLWKAWKEER